MLYAHCILLIDDELLVLEAFELILKACGYKNIIKCSDARDIMDILRKNQIELVLMDLHMPFLSGETVLAQLRGEFPEMPVVIITADSEISKAVACIKAGAYDYLLKPVEKNKLIKTVQNIFKLEDLKKENQILKHSFLHQGLKYPEAFAKIITKSQKMFSIFNYLEAVAGTSQQILVTGETGTGKGLIAKAIHDLSKRSGSFVPVNVASIDANVFSDTLYGHRKGAFTGAADDRAGLIKKATGGTIFLDEIGDLTPELQVSLLHLLEEKRYYPIGSDNSEFTDAKIITATNHNLEKMVKENRFRKDLYYRLITHQVEIPPLRERKDDIPLLVSHFVKHAAKELNKPEPGLAQELFTIFYNYDFPGNIRELESLIYNAMAKCKNKILPLDFFRDLLKPEVVFTEKSETSLQEMLREIQLLPSLKNIDIALINEAMIRAKKNQGIAAKILGITRQALNRRLKILESESKN